MISFLMTKTDGELDHRVSVAPVLYVFCERLNPTRAQYEHLFQVTDVTYSMAISFALELPVDRPNTFT